MQSSKYNELCTIITGTGISLNKSVANTWYKVASITLPYGCWLVISECQYPNLTTAGYIAIAIASKGYPPTQLNSPYSYFNSSMYVNIKRTDFTNVTVESKVIELYVTCTVTSQSTNTNANMYAVKLK